LTLEQAKGVSFFWYTVRYGRTENCF